MRDPNLRLVEIAKSFVGTQEQGVNAGPVVQQFQKAVDGKALGEAWCMCFVQFCIKQVEKEFGIKSMIYKSEHCLTVWNSTLAGVRRMVPEPGRIMIMQRRQKAAGHAGIVSELRSPPAQEFYTIEGNTTSGKGIEREGDGVFEKRRLPDGNNLFIIRGFLQAF